MDTDGSPLSAFLKRILLRSPLTEEEQQAILSLPHEQVPAPARRDLVRPGETVDHAILVCEGLLGRFDLMSSGTRQITAIHLPGDMCDLHSVVAPTVGWGITALAPSNVLHVMHTDLKQLATTYPNIALAFWRDTTVDASVLAKWTANLGRKNARARVAHLLCEMGMRLEMAGLGQRQEYPLDLTQEQVGDVLGLTSVHVNRTLQGLRTERLVSFRSQRVQIFDWKGIAAAAEFMSTYLLYDLDGPDKASARAATPLRFAQG